MPAITALSEQAAINKLAGNASNTSKSHQAQVNATNGSVGKSLQAILNENLGNGNNKTAQTPQQALFNILKTPLSLTGHWSKYSEQQLLNMAYNASIPILTVIGK